MSKRALRVTAGLIIVGTVSIVGTIFLCVNGCSENRVPTPADYKAVLDKISKSPDSVQMNIMVEVGRYELSDDKKKRKMYDEALHRLNYVGE